MKRPDAICLADFGDSGVAFIAMPQNPPRSGVTEPYYEKAVMRLLDIAKIKDPAA